MTETDIYIAYASEDRDIVNKLYGILSKQWDTYWDDLMAGEVQDNVEEEIAKAKCVVAVFSANSRKKPTVISELKNARELGKKILPIRIDKSKPPYSFDTLSIIETNDWRGDIEHPGLKQLIRRLARIAEPKRKPSRHELIAHGRLPSPTFFASVSSHETQLKPPGSAVKALRVFRFPSILVSAYDLILSREPQALIRELKKYRKNGGFVLIDSGNYEASRLSDKSWCPDNLKEALSNSPHDWAFCFDNLNPSRNQKSCVADIIKTVERDQKFTSNPVLPIVHVPKLKSGRYLVDLLPKIIREVSESLSPHLVAIPERDLGAGLISRAKTVRKIRDELNTLSFYQSLHILGTGNPWSLPILAAAGADTFDGLEWCRTVVDRNSNRLHHFHHFDFFAYQSEVADSIVTRDSLTDPGIDFAGKVAFHNLDYYSSFINDIQECMREGNMEAFITGLVGRETVKQLKKQVQGIF